VPLAVRLVRAWVRAADVDPQVGADRVVVEQRAHVVRGEVGRETVVAGLLPLAGARTGGASTSAAGQDEGESAGRGGERGDSGACRTCAVVHVSTPGGSRARAHPWIGAFRIPGPLRASNPSLEGFPRPRRSVSGASRRASAGRGTPG